MLINYLKENPLKELNIQSKNIKQNNLSLYVSVPTHSIHCYLSNTCHSLFNLCYLRNYVFILNIIYHIMFIIHLSKNWISIYLITSIF